MGLKMWQVPKSVSVKRIKAGQYEVYDGSRLLGFVSKTGSHLDDYPWEWHLAVEPMDPAGKAVGYTDLKSVAVDALTIAALWSKP